ncbi:class II fructose-bisphosphate aldolase [Candidatus Curtissbacteria bacterium]|nr:class II fructose-bisphosphate aldolase [Candidatus Curtissbacteria bacterium]
MTAREWFIRAQNEGFAIGAFNVDNFEIFKAICLAGQKKRSPVMMEFSSGEAGYFGLKNIVDLVANARKQYGIPILLNLDHAKTVEDCMEALRLRLRSGDFAVDNSSTSEVKVPHTSEVSFVGFDDIHFDGSELSYEQNVENTKRVVAAAHAKNLLVEGELDKLSGSSEVHTEQIDLEILKKSYSDPLRAAKFVAETGVDIFASVFGNIHGTFPNQPDLDIELLKKIKEALPNTFLSLHGGSGIPAEQIREAIKVGRIVKVNVNTEIRQAFKDALNEKIGENPNEYTYYKLASDIVMAVTAVVEGKIDVFGSAGKI